MAERRDTRTGQHRSGFLDAELLETVRAIVLTVDPDWPEDVTRTRYDRARKTSDWPEAPSAQALERRWKITWEQLLRVLFSEETDAEISILRRTMKVRRAGLTLDDAVYALRLVALRLGVKTLTAAQYDAEVEAIEREGGTTSSSAVHAHSETERLPRSADIERALREEGRGGWTVALEAAGLAPTRPRSSTKVLSAEEGVHAFLSEIGCLPWSRPALHRYTRAKGLPITTVTSFPAAVKAARTSWQQMGRWTPATAPPPEQRPEINVERVSVEEGGYKRWDKTSTTEEVVEGLVFAYREAHRQGVELTQPRLRELAGKHHEVPQPSFVQRHATQHAKPKTSAAALRREAAKRFQEELAAAGVSA